MIKLSDKDLRDKKGFDERSFRKEPGEKKRKGKAKRRR
jgi:hypothetical protein